MEESDDEENSTDNDVSDDEENNGVQNCLEHFIKLENLQVSDFVYVGLKTNKPGNFTTRNHYVGQVVAIEEKEVEIKYMKKTGSSSIWPIVEDAAWTSRDDIHVFFTIPEIDRQQHFTFNDLDQINMLNCCK